MYLVYNLMSGGKQERPLVQEPQVVEKKVAEQLVYVAKQEIPVGTVIEQSMLDRQVWPKNLVGPSFIVANEKAPNIVGMVARSHFQPREVILRSKLANPNDPSFLAANMPEGMRAVTISINGVTGVAGFVQPGDRIDLLFTHSLVSEKEKEGAEVTEDEDDDLPASYEKKVTEILVPDVRVLALDRKAMAGGEEKNKQRMPSSVTLEVSQEDAQRVRLAEREGELSLALRSLKDKGEMWVRPSGQEDLTRALPPAYFPELHDFDATYTPEEAKKAEKKKEDTTKSVITVVRGSKVEEMEIESEEE